MRFGIVLALMTGCIEGYDDGGAVTATWHLVSITGEPVGCPAGFGSAALVVSPNFATTSPPDLVFTSCAADTVTSEYAYGRGLNYAVAVEITSDDHETPLARSPTTDENDAELS